MPDPWVQKAQRWVNATYKNIKNFVPAPEDGRTGWRTMFAFTRALQIELKIPLTDLSDNFGPGTMKALTDKYREITGRTSNANVRALVQCALWCKGYPGDNYLGKFGTWDDVTAGAVVSVRLDLGVGGDAVVYPKLFKSLLTMDAYTLVSGGTAPVRTVQRDLNSRYSARADFSLVPCDGLYTRDLQKGLIYAIQYSMDMVDGVAIGEVGPATLAHLKTAPFQLAQGTADSANYNVHLFQAAMLFNGYDAGAYDGVFSAALVAKVKAFQAFVQLSETGKADYPTWAALLVSYGDPKRTARGLDCSDQITSTVASRLRNSGFTHVGRYLNGGSAKRIGSAEMNVLWSAGFKWIPVWQEENGAASDFSYALGQEQGQRMMLRLRALGVKSDALAFLAVDYDATDDDIMSAVVPHFRGVLDALSAGWKRNYRLGVYGTRNVASRLATKNLTVATWASSMSSGYSGNLGFSMPSNWMYDQIENLASADNSGPYPIEIDRDVVHTNAEALGKADVTRVPTTYLNGVAAGYDEYFHWPMVGLQYAIELCLRDSDASVAVANELILTRLQKPRFWSGGPSGATGVLWATVVTPEIWSRFAAPDETIKAIQAAQTTFEAALGGGGLFPLPSGVSVRFGKTDHWAASTRGYTAWGVPTTTDSVSNGDMTSWALDLVTLWNDYENARVTAAGKLGKTARQWIAENCGSRNGTHFDIGDLRADASAYLVARAILSDTHRSLDDIVREHSIAIEDDPGWLAKQFFALRFGTHAVLIAAVKNVFTDPWPMTAWPKDHFIEVRNPGTSAPKFSPSATILASELNDVAEGFADAVTAAMSWTER